MCSFANLSCLQVQRTADTQGLMQMRRLPCRASSFPKAMCFPLSKRCLKYDMTKQVTAEVIRLISYITEAKGLPHTGIGYLCAWKFKAAASVTLGGWSFNLYSLHGVFVPRIILAIGVISPSSKEIFIPSTDFISLFCFALLATTGYFIRSKFEPNSTSKTD